MASTTSSSHRGSILAALTGLIVLGLMVAFTLGLTAVADDDTNGADPDPDLASASTEPIDMPDTLPGDLVSATGDAMPTELSDLLGGKEELVTQFASAAEGITDLYGGPAAYAYYGRTDQSALASIVVASTTGGLFLPNNVIPLDAQLAEESGVARPSQIVEEYDGAHCYVAYAAAIPVGQEVDEAEVPTNVTCQYEQDGRTYQISAQGLTEKEAVTALKGLADYVAGDEDAVPDVADLPPVPTAPEPEVAPTSPAPTR